MKKIKRIITALLMLALLGVNIPVFNVRAADINVSIALSASSIKVGDSVTATISVSGSNISAYTIYVSYSSSILSYSSGSGMVSGGGGTATISGTGAGSVSITFTAIASGTASISTYGDDAWSIEASQLSISHAGVNVSVSSGSTEAPATTEANSTTTEEQGTTEATTEEQDTSKCFLKSLSVTPGKLEPAFSRNTTSYFVQVDKDVKAIDVSAAAETSSSSVNVRGADSIEPGENYIYITVSSDTGATKTYNIRVMAGEEKGEARTTINGKELFFVMDKELENIPEGFKAVDETYDDWDIVAFSSPNKKLLLVCLEDENKNQKFYIYDKDNNVFTLYKEYLAGQNRYIILDWNKDVEVPEGCVITQIKIDGEMIQAYRLDGDYYLLYAMNIEGDEGIYLYDSKEKTFMRYMGEKEEETVTTEEEATPEDATISDATVDEIEDEGFFTKQMLMYFLFGAAGLLLILLIIIICMGVKNHKLKKRIRENDEAAEDEAIEDEAIEYVSEAEAYDVYVAEEIKVAAEEKIEENKKDKDVEKIEETRQHNDENNFEEGKTKELSKEADKAADKNENINAEHISEDELKENAEDETEKSSEDTKEASETVTDIEEDGIPQIKGVASKEETYEEYKKQSEEIQNKIKVSYDANMDSAFDINE